MHISCSDRNDFDFFVFSEVQLNLIDSKNDYRRSTYIPVSSPLLQNNVWNKGSSSAEAKDATNQNTSLSRDKRETAPVMPVNELNAATNATDTPIVTTTIDTADELDATVESQRENFTEETVSGTAPSYDSESASSQNTHNEHQYPHFHVTYWMFYPYSQVSPQHLPFIFPKFNLSFSLHPGQSNLHLESGPTRQPAHPANIRRLSGYQKRFRQSRGRLGTHDTLLQWPRRAR